MEIKKVEKFIKTKYPDAKILGYKNKGNLDKPNWVLGIELDNKIIEFNSKYEQITGEKPKRNLPDEF